MNVLEWEERQGTQWTLWVLESDNGEGIKNWNCADNNVNYNKNNRFAPRGAAGCDPAFYRQRIRVPVPTLQPVSQKIFFFLLGVVFRPIISLEVEAEGWEGGEG